VTASLTDTHCHLGHIDRPLEEALNDAAAAGVETVIDIGMGTKESTISAGRASDHSGLIHACVGIHPNDLEEFEADPDGTMATIGELASAPGVVGIGETGLDTYRDRSPVELQERAFRAHIDLAKQADRTLVIHCRDAHHRVLAVLDEVGAPSRVVMHCFSGDAEFAGRCAERGFFGSFAGNLTYRKNEELRRAARTLPPELLLIETDSPFLAPDPYRGKPNHPGLLPHTAQTLASERSMSLKALSEVLADNTRAAFGL
jgi:TatD DNase family protein